MQDNNTAQLIGLIVASAGLIGLVVKWFMSVVNRKDTYIEKLIDRSDIKEVQRKKEWLEMHNNHEDTIRTMVTRHATTLNNHLEHQEKEFKEQTQVLRQVSKRLEQMNDAQISVAGALDANTKLVSQMFPLLEELKIKR